MVPFRFGLQWMRALSASEWRETARRAEQEGYSTLLVPDHTVWSLAVTPALVAAADATERLRVGSLVFDNDFRHPLLLAREAATIDLLTEGRLELGLGAGWAEREYREAGIPFDPAGVRLERLEEAVAIVKSYFHSPRLEHVGRHYQVRGHFVSTPCVQQPHPPILLGGGGRRMLRLAGREADIVNVTFNLRHGLGKNAEKLTTERMLEKMAWVREGARGRSSPVELSTIVFWGGITDDPMAAVTPVAERVGFSPSEALESPAFLFGSRQAVEEKLLGLRETFGFSYVIFSELGCDVASLAPVVASLAGR